MSSHLCGPRNPSSGSSRAQSNLYRQQSRMNRLLPALACFGGEGCGHGPGVGRIAGAGRALNGFGKCSTAQSGTPTGGTRVPMMSTLSGTRSWPHPGHKARSGTRLIARGQAGRSALLPPRRPSYRKASEYECPTAHRNMKKTDNEEHTSSAQASGVACRDPATCPGHSTLVFAGASTKHSPVHFLRRPGLRLQRAGASRLARSGDWLGRAGRGA
jgi:hypothetical protein